MTTDVYNEYKKLLEKGINNIDAGYDASLEEHLLSNSDDYECIKNINKYGYTTYSTNFNDKTYSIDLFILNDYVELLIDKLRNKGLWFIKKDNKTNIIINVDNSINNDKYKLQVTDNNDLLNKNYWTLVDNSNNLYEKDLYIYFLNDENINELSYDLYRQLSFNYVKGNTIDYDLLINNISYFIIEDPVIDRKTLYSDLLSILSSIKK
jgi:hypothetical protein